MLQWEPRTLKYFVDAAAAVAAATANGTGSALNFYYNDDMPSARQPTVPQSSSHAHQMPTRRRIYVYGVGVAILFFIFHCALSFCHLATRRDATLPLLWTFRCKVSGIKMAWQIIFIIFNYISLCNCARALAFAHVWRRGRGPYTASNSVQSLSTGSLFSVLFSCDTKKEAKSQSRCCSGKVGFYQLAACISFGHFFCVLTMLSVKTNRCVCHIPCKQA